MPLGTFGAAVVSTSLATARAEEGAEHWRLQAAACKTPNERVTNLDAHVPTAFSPIAALRCRHCVRAPQQRLGHVAVDYAGTCGRTGSMRRRTRRIRHLRIDALLRRRRRRSVASSDRSAQQQIAIASLAHMRCRIALLFTLRHSHTVKALLKADLTHCQLTLLLRRSDWTHSPLCASRNPFHNPSLPSLSLLLFDVCAISRIRLLPSVLTLIRSTASSISRWRVQRSDAQAPAKTRLRIKCAERICSEWRCCD